MVYEEATPSMHTFSVFVLYLRENAIWCHPWFAKTVPRPCLLPPLSCKVSVPVVVETSMLKWDVPPSKERTRPNTLGVSNSFTHMLAVCSDASSVPDPVNFQYVFFCLTRAVFMSGAAVVIEFGVHLVAADLFHEASSPTTHV